MCRFVKKQSGGFQARPKANHPPWFLPVVACACVRSERWCMLNAPSHILCLENYHVSSKFDRMKREDEHGRARTMCLPIYLLDFRHVFFWPSRRSLRSTLVARDRLSVCHTRKAQSILSYSYANLYNYDNLSTANLFLSLIISPLLLPRPHWVVVLDRRFSSAFGTHDRQVHLPPKNPVRYLQRFHLLDSSWPPIHVRFQL
jgi:hypothetical protein